MNLESIHHVAIICSDYQRSKSFYTEILGLKILAENYRESRDSYKLDLALPNGGQIELFSFPEPPSRLSNPEAQGLRHLLLTRWNRQLTSYNHTELMLSQFELMNLQVNDLPFLKTQMVYP